jgi:hypothetical protein
MKKQNLFATLGVALVSLGFSASPARALTYVQGDMLLGFYATGGEGSSTSVVLNIGQASLYRDHAGAPFNLSIGSIQTDLVNAFGADWKSRGDVLWGVYGGNWNAAVGSDSLYTLYGVRERSTADIQAQAYNLGSAATQSQPSTKIKDFGEAYALTGTASGLTTGVNPFASIQSSFADNDFAEYQTNNGGTSFGYFQAALGDFTNGTSGSVLDLFRMQTGSSSSKGTYEGSFTISDSGIVTFGVVAVPEPTTISFVLLAGGMLVVFALRRGKAAV